MTDPKKHPEAVRLGRKGGNAKAAKTTGFPAMGCIVPPPCLTSPARRSRSRTRSISPRRMPR